jgi:nucleoside-diphosphate-sugar epimerase
MRILIVGGTGLISTGITTQLLARGDQVVHYNRGQRTKPPAGVEQIIGDRKDFAAFEAAMQAQKPFDAVIDMVCFTPDEARSLARACSGRTPHLIFCSTVDSFEKPYRYYPIDDRHPLLGLSGYGKMKAECERILLEAGRGGSFATTVIRPAHTYGEGAGFIHSFGWRSFFLDRLRKGKPIIVHGDGTSLWGSCHRDDVARAFVGACGNPLSFGQSYNAAAEQWVSWNDYTRIIARAMGAPEPTLVHIPTDILAHLSPEHTWVNMDNFQFSNIFATDAARRDLGFAYTIRLEAGARRCVGYLEVNSAIESWDSLPIYDQIIDAWNALGREMRRRFGK